MQNDPIVDAIHRLRESLAREFDFNVSAIFADMRTREALVGGRLISPIANPDTPTRPKRNTSISGSTSAAG